MVGYKLEGSQLERAQELLILVEKAHQEFDYVQNHPEWIWDQDKQTPPGGPDVQVSEYQIIERFGISEFSLSFSDFLKQDITKLFPRLQNPFVEQVPFGFIAQKGNEIFVAFRGTMTRAEWILNSRFDPGHDSFLGNDDLGQIHRGFGQIYTRQDHPDNSGKFNLKPMYKEIEEALKKLPPQAQVYVTGHSLGGALATLCTLHIKTINHFQSQPILYAFANPRVGNETFAGNFQDLDCYRIANSEDIVPTLPLASVDLVDVKAEDTVSKSLQEAKSFLPFRQPDLDFHHVGKPVYFTLHRGSISENHIIPAYKIALGI